MAKQYTAISDPSCITETKTLSPWPDSMGYNRLPKHASNACAGAFQTSLTPVSAEQSRFGVARHGLKRGLKRMGQCCVVPGASHAAVQSCLLAFAQHVEADVLAKSHRTLLLSLRPILKAQLVSLLAHTPSGVLPDLARKSALLEVLRYCCKCVFFRPIAGIDVIRLCSVNNTCLW